MPLFQLDNPLPCNSALGARRPRRDQTLGQGNELQSRPIALRPLPPSVRLPPDSQLIRKPYGNVLVELMALQPRGSLC